MSALYNALMIGDEDEAISCMVNGANPCKEMGYGGSAFQYALSNRLTRFLCFAFRRLYDPFPRLRYSPRQAIPLTWEQMKCISRSYKRRCKNLSKHLTRHLGSELDAGDDFKSSFFSRVSGFLLHEHEIPNRLRFKQAHNWGAVYVGVTLCYEVGRTVRSFPVRIYRPDTRDIARA